MENPPLVNHFPRETILRLTDVLFWGGWSILLVMNVTNDFIGVARPTRKTYLLKLNMNEF
jgi:hypothetical protein